MRKATPHIKRLRQRNYYALNAKIPDLVASCETRAELDSVCMLLVSIRSAIVALKFKQLEVSPASVRQILKQLEEQDL